MEQLIRNFLWGSSQNARKCHLVNWQTVTLSKPGGGLGLRRLDLMNEAFLAKLRWRLLQNENGLWAQVLKTKYSITSTDCTTWRPKSSMSVVWKGILKSVPILVKGSAKLPKNGSNTTFWNDKWVGDGPLINKATTFVHLPDRYRSVRSYWCSRFGWKWDQLQHTLPQAVLDEIAAIIIEDDTDLEDLTVWRHESASLFSVSSAYDIACNHPAKTEAAKWNAIWKLKLPSRIKTFLWLARHEKILTNSSRARRGMTDDSFCHICRDKIEDADHVMRKCPATNLLWSKVLPSFHANTLNESFKEWLDHGISNKGNHLRPVNDNVIFAVTIWLVWKWRNEEIFSNSTHHLHSKVSWINSQVEEISAALGKKSSPLPSINSYKWERIVWSKLEEGMIKINFDGAADPLTGKAGCGSVMRDSYGLWRGGLICNIGSCPPLQAEAWALLRSIQLAIHMNVRRAIFEGDSQELGAALNADTSTTNATCNILNACRRELRQLDDWRLCIIPRESNAPADSMARLAKGYPRGIHIIHEPSACILNLLEQDWAGLPKWRLLYNSS